MKTNHRRPGFRGSTAIAVASTLVNDMTAKNVRYETAHPFATDSPAAVTANTFGDRVGS
jgi:hypothetical protein